jgi:hypothetical protein
MSKLAMMLQEFRTRHWAKAHSECAFAAAVLSYLMLMVTGVD